MVSTPSRSRQATRISAPLIASPRSGAALAAASGEVVLVLMRKRIATLHKNKGRGKRGSLGVGRLRVEGAGGSFGFRVSRWRSSFGYLGRRYRKRVSVGMFHEVKWG